jgi:hypothetical protein
VIPHTFVHGRFGAYDISGSGAHTFQGALLTASRRGLVRLTRSATSLYAAISPWENRGIIPLALAASQAGSAGSTTPALSICAPSTNGSCVGLLVDSPLSLPYERNCRFPAVIPMACMSQAGRSDRVNFAPAPCAMYTRASFAHANA